jgi:hypothetical protein
MTGRPGQPFALARTPAAAQPVSAATARASASRLTASRFVVLVLLSCLVLQRFALPAGGGLEISLATPLVLGLSGWALGAGLLRIDRLRAAVFLGLCFVASVATAVHINLPLAIAPRFSIPSLIYWLAITGFGVFGLREPLPESVLFRLLLRCLALVAVAGLLQFAAQFAGLRLFAFSGVVPDRFLIEGQYNLVIPFGSGDALKSNGFFLVEPSVFSQFMAVGVIAEAIAFRRPAWLLLFLAGLLASASGTGWLVLGAYVAWTAIGSGLRGLWAALVVSLTAALTFVAASLVLPDVTGSLSSRLGEFSEPGSSGYDRFVTPVPAWRAVLKAAPWSFFTGIGPGASEQLLVPFVYTLNTPIKILTEYGLFGLLLYLGLLLCAQRSPWQAALTPPLLVLLLLTGGYHQFSPILFPVLLLINVVRLRRDEPAPQQQFAKFAHITKMER